MIVFFSHDIQSPYLQSWQLAIGSKPKRCLQNGKKTKKKNLNFTELIPIDQMMLLPDIKNATIVKTHFTAD